MSALAARLKQGLGMPGPHEMPEAEGAPDLDDDDELDEEAEDMEEYIQRVMEIKQI